MIKELPFVLTKDSPTVDLPNDFGKAISLRRDDRDVPCVGGPIFDLPFDLHYYFYRGNLEVDSYFGGDVSGSYVLTYEPLPST